MSISRSSRIACCSFLAGWRFQPDLELRPSFRRIIAHIDDFADVETVKLQGFAAGPRLLPPKQMPGEGMNHALAKLLGILLWMADKTPRIAKRRHKAVLAKLRKPLLAKIDDVVP